uniref:GST N-terminal domain-containing protein n=1 Tax=Mesocestoides corti TaxID=53468 RepID=A0A5K3FGD7_MESCO
MTGVPSTILEAKGKSFSTLLLIKHLQFSKFAPTSFEINDDCTQWVDHMEVMRVL